MEILDKNGMKIRHKRIGKAIATGDAPDIVMIPIKRKDRKNLPPKVKVVFFCLIEQGYISKEIFEDCFKSHPEYFMNTKKKEDEKE